MAEETRIGGPEAGFLSTRWTHVLRARDLAAPDRREALERLMRAYWKPLYFLIRRRGHPVEPAKDLAQGFFAAFLERDFLQYVDEKRGKFRIFLRVALDHYLADEHDRASALKRGGDRRAVPLDFAQAELEVGRGAAWNEDPERLFCRKWALAVVEHALEGVRRLYEGSGRSQEFAVLVPYLTDGATGTYADGARLLGTSESDFANRLHRLRRSYRESILAEVRDSTDTEQEAQEELRDLFSSLGA